jgi:hypothetical protein
MSILNTDLHIRERVRFAVHLELVAKDAAKLAAALRAEDDTEAFICLITMSLSLTILDDLRKVFEQTLIAAKTKAPDDASALIKENKSP